MSITLFSLGDPVTLSKYLPCHVSPMHLPRRPTPVCPQKTSPLKLSTPRRAHGRAQALLAREKPQRMPLDGAPLDRPANHGSALHTRLGGGGEDDDDPPTPILAGLKTAPLSVARPRGPRGRSPDQDSPFASPLRPPAPSAATATPDLVVDEAGSMPRGWLRSPPKTPLLPAGPAAGAAGKVHAAPVAASLCGQGKGDVGSGQGEAGAGRCGRSGAEVSKDADEWSPKAPDGVALHAPPPPPSAASQAPTERPALPPPSPRNEPLGLGQGYPGTPETPGTPEDLTVRLFKAHHSALTSTENPLT
jgi:hypothetical protein